MVNFYPPRLRPPTNHPQEGAEVKYTGDRITFYNVIGFHPTRDKLNLVYSGYVIIDWANLVSENNL